MGLTRVRFGIRIRIRIRNVYRNGIRVRDRVWVIIRARRGLRIRFVSFGGISMFGLFIRCLHYLRALRRFALANIKHGGTTFTNCFNQARAIIFDC